MSREIKFRAFNKGTGKMIDLYRVTPLALDATLNCDGLFIPFREGYELMQYTGLKDKNGIEIFEGDVVRYSYHRDRSGKDIQKFTNVIEWDDSLTDHQGFHIHTLMNPEVIGNKFSNPELLEQP
jgi:uncharacterized phage protein (TIGR01671 family)